MRRPHTRETIVFFAGGASEITALPFYPFKYEGTVWRWAARESWCALYKSNKFGEQQVLAIAILDTY